MSKAGSQPVAGWTICYILGTSPYKSTPCNQLGFDTSGEFGCWHYSGGNGGWGNAGNACKDNVQHTTRYDGWGGTSHSLVACIKN
jgi:hypothetical protein